MPDSDDEFPAYVRNHVPADPDVQSCWHMITQGVRARWLERGGIEHLVECLNHYDDYGTGELLFDNIDGRLRVSFLGDYAECARDALVEELNSLLARSELR
jgi:hypothetical protein